jgi:HEAT repeat protein
MRKRSWLILAVCGIALLIGLAAFLLQSEPIYQDRTLTSWLEDLPPPRLMHHWPGGQTVYIVSFWPPVRSQKEAKALEAIRRIGTNGLPVLEAILRRREDGPLEKTLIARVNKQSFLKIKLFTSEQRRLQAYSALIELGQVAEPVWRDLLLDEQLLLGQRQHIVTLLRDMAPQSAVPPLVAALSVTNTALRTNAAYALASMGKQARGAIPALLKGVEDQDPATRLAFATALRKCEPDSVLSLTRSLKYDSPTFRLGAARSLGFLKERPELSIPALIQSANDPEYRVREAAISALADFGVQAQSALPLVLAARTDTNNYVRIAATNALDQIRPSSVATVDLR